MFLLKFNLTLKYVYHEMCADTKCVHREMCANQVPPEGCGKVFLMHTLVLGVIMLNRRAWAQELEELLIMESRILLNPS